MRAELVFAVSLVLHDPCEPALVKPSHASPPDADSDARHCMQQ